MGLIKFVADTIKEHEAELKAERDRLPRANPDYVLYSGNVSGPVTVYLGKYGTNSLDFVNEKTGSGISFDFTLWDKYSKVTDFSTNNIGSVIAHQNLAITVIRDDSRFGIGSLTINCISESGERFTQVYQTSQANYKIYRRIIHKWKVDDSTGDWDVFGYMPSIYDYSGYEIPESE